MPAHKHIQLMRYYTRVAEFDEQPWLRFQWRYSNDDDWKDCDKPCSFKAELQYRPKPARTFETSGGSFQEPETSFLGLAEVYYFVNLESPESIGIGMWNEEPIDLARLRNGIIHLTKEAALEHAKVLLNINRGIKNDRT